MSKGKQKSKFSKPNKDTNLMPWLDYFDMLGTHVKLGYLQLDIPKHEAYVTQPAIHAMSEGSDPKKQNEDGSVIVTAGRIRYYAAWLSKLGKAYLQANFAVHVVKPDEPHDLIYTFVFTRKSRFFKWRDKVNVITYPEK